MFIIIGCSGLLFLLSLANQKEPGFGATTDVEAIDAELGVVHFMSLNLDNWNEYVKKLSTSNRPVILHIGNSQTQSINQFSNGDSNFVSFLNLLDSVHLHAAATLPNLNMSEANLLFDNILEKIAIDKLYLPLFFDDFRETGLRSGLEVFTSNRDTVINHIRIGKKAEEYILQIGFVKTIYDFKDALRSSLYVGAYRIRNTIFGIKPTTVRRKSPPAYNENWNELVGIIQTAENFNIDVVLYIPPIRGDYEIPYDYNEYQKFKEELQTLTRYEHVELFNFENGVGPELWGKKAGTSLSGEEEIDFMHFTASGHRALSKLLKSTY